MPAPDSSKQTATNSIPDKTVNVLQTLSTSSKNIPTLPETSSALPVAEIPITAIPVKEVPIIEPPVTVAPPTILEKTETIVTPVPLEKIEKEKVPQTASIEKKTPPKENIPDPKLAQYLASDRVYQAMLRVENHEKIRLQYAIRYTLLMFAIFLVFAWIVNNRVIMFGFSEFLWLARIRDALFAIMAGLFTLTIWYGSDMWLHKKLFINLLRTFSAVFFVAILSALYIF